MYYKFNIWHMYNGEKGIFYFFNGKAEILNQPSAGC